MAGRRADGEDSRFLEQTKKKKTYSNYKSSKFFIPAANHLLFRIFCPLTLKENILCLQFCVHQLPVSTIRFPVVWAPTRLAGLFTGARPDPGRSLIPADDQRLVKGLSTRASNWNSFPVTDRSSGKVEVDIKAVHMGNCESEMEWKRQDGRSRPQFQCAGSFFFCFFFKLPVKETSLFIEGAAQTTKHTHSCGDSPPTRNSQLHSLCYKKIVINHELLSFKTWTGGSLVTECCYYFQLWCC